MLQASIDIPDKSNFMGPSASRSSKMQMFYSKTQSLQKMVNGGQKLVWKKILALTFI